MKTKLFLALVCVALAGCGDAPEPVEVSVPKVYPFSKGQIVEHVVDGRKGIVIERETWVGWEDMGCLVQFPSSSGAYENVSVPYYAIRPAAPTSLKLEAAP